MRSEGIKSSLLSLAICAMLAFAAPKRAEAVPSIVVDAETGVVIYAEDADRLWHPASLTKLMTAYLTFEAIRDGKLSLEDKLRCSHNAVTQPPSKIGLPVGDEMSVDLGLKALIVKSANDVAVMLAEKVAGSEASFVERMNETAKRLGMSRTKFFNANGLPHPEQVTTARDMARLGRALLKEFPQYAYLYSLTSFQMGKREIGTHNEILRMYEGANGMKTGFICASGYNLVASASRNGRQMIAVVLGANSGLRRSQLAADLMQYGFEYYSWKSLFPTSISEMTIDESATEAPGNMSGVVCGGAARVVEKRKKLMKKKAAPVKSKVQQASGN